ncbi:MAG TPA: hypothetical protein DDZ51_15420 [Planctomycetaceae bacterium]|nr:hypothetical protein [Planctomycetaceae bacterium]
MAMASIEQFRIRVKGWLFVLWNFVDSWFATLPWRRLVFGIPFVATLSLLGLLYQFGGNLQSGWRNQLVKGRADRATSSGDWKTAKLLWFRLLKSDPANLEYQFQLAQIHLASEEPELAIQIVRELVFTDKEKRSQAWDTTAAADRDAGGRPPIPSQRFRFRGTDPRLLIWMIEHVYDQTPWDELDPQDQDDCLAMFATLHWLAPTDQTLAQRYAERLLQAGRYPEALPVLVSLIPTAPGIGLRAAIIARNQRLDDKAAAYAEESRQRFSVLVQQNPDSAELAVSLARCQVFLGQHAEAIATLDRAIANVGDQQKVGILLGIRVEAIVAWADAVQTQPNPAVTDRLRLLQHLEQSLGHAPNHPQLLQMVISHVLAIQADSDRQVSEVRQALINGVSPGLAHFIHGTAATIEGRKDQARTHLELAAQAFPDSDVILNNLAHVLSQGDGANLETALTLSDTAIERASAPTPYHHDTRGRILHKLGRWKEAVVDLQQAVREPQLASNAHRILADCYQHLELKELAAMHTAAAEQK